MTGDRRSGVVVVTPEPVAERMAGPAIRALELGRALARDGRSGPVRVVSLTTVEREDPLVALTSAADEPTLRRLVADAAVVVVQGDVLGLHPWLVDEPVAIVVDAYDPYHLEQLEQARPRGELAAARRGAGLHPVAQHPARPCRPGALRVAPAAGALDRSPGRAGTRQPPDLRPGARSVAARGSRALRGP